MRSIGKKGYISYSDTAKTMVVRGEVHSATCTEKMVNKELGEKFIRRIAEIAWDY